MSISKYITLSEATKSPVALRLGIDNTPTIQIIENMQYVAVNLFDKVREHLNAPIHVNSFYRCPGLNTAIGGSSTSDHMQGKAIDVDATGSNNNSEIFFYVKDHCEYDQVIAEFRDDAHPAWVHMSLRKANNRKQALIAHTENGKTVYSPYTDALFDSIYRK